MKITHKNTVTLLWLLLVVLTLFNAFISETAKPGFSSTMIIALVLAIKGRIIVDHFMELKDAHVLLRSLMRGYFYVIPALIVLVYFFPENIAAWTKL